MKRAGVGGLLLLGGLLGAACSSSAPRTSGNEARDEAVLEASVRYELARLSSPGAGHPVARICVATDVGSGPKDPSDRLLRALLDVRPVRPASNCASAPARTPGAPESDSLTVGPIDWRAPDEARVAVVCHRAASGPERATLRVVRQPAGWAVAGPIVIYDPL
jgi:hypothetical protein